MHMIRAIGLAVFLTGMIIPVNVWADAASDFARGSELFRSGDYSTAARYFESARKQGMSSVALYYNLGSSYFKLGEYEGARHYFLIVAREPRMKDLAEFNLGLIAQKQGDFQQADDYFQRVVTSSSDEKLRAMAENKLAVLQRGKRPWTGFLSASFGYDDNITAAPAEATQGVADQYYDVFAMADVLVSGRRKQGWLAEFSFFNIDFFDTDSYDEYLYVIGMRREQQLWGWDTRSSLSMSKSNYAEQDFQTIYKLELRARQTLASGTRLQLQYRYEDINSDNSLYDYLQGWRQKLGASLRFYEQDYNWQLYYELELNDREDLILSGYEASYSPTRHNLGGKYSYRWNANWDLVTDLSYRTSDYPATLSQDRQDDRWRLRLDAEYRLDRYSKLRGRIQYMDNESSVDNYDYDKTLISIAYNRLF